MIIWNLLWGAIAGLLIDQASNWLPRTQRALRTAPQRRESICIQLIVVLVSALFFTYTNATYGWSWKAATLLLVYNFFLLIALIDLKFQLIPNFLVYPSTALVLLFHVVFSSRPIVLTIMGGALAFTVFYLTAALKIEEVGGGDIKLATLIGLAFGFPGGMYALLVGACIGGIAIFLLRVLSSTAVRRHWPYAPFLCLGAVITAVYNPTDILLPLLT